MIRVERLSKSYRTHSRSAGVIPAIGSFFRRPLTEVRAVDSISFEVPEGQRLGFLGPNGAGKTTTLKMLAGLLHPTSGVATVRGFLPLRREREFLRSITLVMGQKQQLLWDLPPSETFELNRAIYDIDLTRYRRTLDELVTLLALGDLVGKPTRQLSLGERMKCELAAALLHEPRVLFLDEPTIGLDVTMQATVRSFIRSYNKRHNATVLLTSHYMEDVSALADRVIVINHGRITHDGPLASLVSEVRPEKRVTLVFERPGHGFEPDPKFGARVVDTNDTSVTLIVATALAPALIKGAFERLRVTDLTVENAPLEEVLSTLFGRPN